MALWTYLKTQPLAVSSSVASLVVCIGTLLIAFAGWGRVANIATGTIMAAVLLVPIFLIVRGVCTTLLDWFVKLVG